MARDYYDESKDKKKKKKEETPQQKVTKSPSTTKATTKANETAKKSTFLGGGSDVKKVEQNVSKQTTGSTVTKRTTTTTTTSETRRQQAQNQKSYGTTTPKLTVKQTTKTTTPKTTSQRTIDAQNQKSYGTTTPKLTVNTAEERRKKREEREQRQEQARLRKSGLTPEQQPSAETKAAANRALRNTPELVKKAGKDVGSGYLQTLNDITERTASAKTATAAKAAKMGVEPGTEQYKKIEEERKRTAEEARKSNESLYEKMQQRQAAWDEKTKDAKGLEKAYYGAVESGTGMLADTAIGLLTGTGQVGALTSMGMRTYGSSANQAKAEGATDEEAGWYGLGQAAKEMGTEMIGGGGLAKLAYGKGALGLGDIAANTLIRNLKGETADLAHMGIRLLGDVAEENIEEVAGWSLDPWIKELTYGRNVRMRNAQVNMKDKSDALRSEIQNEDDARAAAAYLSSDDFIEQTKQEYIAAGLKEKDAKEVAERMRDYLTASLTGDTDSMEKIENEVSKKVAKSHNVWKDYDFRELKETIEATTLLVGATGLPVNIKTSAKGGMIKEQLGDDGIRSLATNAVEFEDSDMSLKAKAMKARLDEGKELTNTQAYELMSGMQEQVRRDTEREQSSRRMAERTIQSDNLLTPYRPNENGGVDLDPATEAAYREQANNAGAIINALADDSKESITDTEVVNGSKAIAGFQTGVFTVDDANALNYSNTTVRAAFEEATGINLDQYVVRDKNGEVNIPATNTATKNALFAMAADNLVKSAQIETANWMDNTKGQVVTQVSSRMGASGTAVLQQALDTVDERDRSKYMMTANATDMMYQTARNTGIAWSDVASEATKMFPGISEANLQMMYEAGLTDRDMANDKARGRQIIMGETLSEMGEQETATGKVFIDTEVPPKGSAIRTFTEIAKNLGADIHLVDYIYDSEGNPIDRANGSYDPNTNTFYLNVSTGAEQNVGYIFMHEMTHYLKTFAPEQYQELENLVRDRWFAFNPSQMQDAIARKIEAYKRVTDGKQVLTEEQALEEIIADAAHDFINDPEFAKQVAEEDMGLAKAMLQSIRNALRMLRKIFASGSVDDSTYMNSLFRELDILSEAEELWLNAYKVAVKNNAAAGLNLWQEEANAQSNPSLSITTDEEALPKGGALPASLKKWAKEVGLDTLTKQDIKAPVIVSVKNLRSAWYEKNGRSQEAETINQALAQVGESLTNLVGEYKYIDLSDALNATVHYRTDSEGKPTSVILSCQVKNAEYEVNFDFTTICAKRLAMQKVLEKFIKTEGESKGTLYDELKLDEEGMYKLRLILETAGFEVSCRGCFVEQNRYSQQNQARTIANDWNAALDAWAAENGVEINDNFDLVNLDINALDYDEIERGFAKYHELMKGQSTNVETKNRMLIESSPFFRKRMNSSDYASLAGQRALMAIGESKKGGTSLYGLLKRGQSDSKQSVPFTAYNGEVALLPDKMKGKSLYDYLISIGGARAQSASDFQIEFLYDYMQLVADLSARNLPMHMYTKVIELAELFGMTGIKINLSAMCDVDESLTGEYAGLKLVDGKYEYNISDQSIDYPKAVELQKKEGYSKNIGIIMVTLSSQHMLKSLDDPDVRYIIGYHSSAMPVVVANMSKMGNATDYTKLNKTSKLSWKGEVLFEKAKQQAKGDTELARFKDALRIFDEMIQTETEETAKKKNKPKPRRGNEYGTYMTPYKGNTADFNTYDDIQKTNDARKTADNYIEWCMNNDYIPMYFPFTFHDNYYKCEVYDFNMYDNVTGEYAPMQGVQNIYPGLNMAAGETDTTQFMNRVSEMMGERNAFNEVQSAMYEPVIEQAKNELRYSITGDDYMDFDASGIDHNELTHRADAVKSEAQLRDEAYMSAVESGNMTEAQKLVDEAAKMAGYDTPRLYHGTPSFGFTVFDRDKLEDGFSIFATNNPLTAETYSGVTDRSKISDRSTVDVDSLYGEALLNEASKYRKKYSDYRLMTRAEQERMLDESRAEVKLFAQDAANYIEEHKDSFDEEKLAIANRIVDSINRISTAWAEDMVDSAWNDFEDAVWDLKWMDESIQMELTQALQSGGSLLYWKNKISDMMYSGDIYRDKTYENEYIFDNQLALELESDLSKGIYGLYGKSDNQLVINTNGENWNAITPPDELNLYGLQKTRWIAEAARSKGYDSILFKDLRDNGGETAYNGASDVYIFFNPSQVKSADTITYAEDGSVIPLSERFDPTNNDIRYSLPTTDAEGRVLSDGQMEYFANSQARDEQGRLVSVYHTTDKGGFTVFDPMKSDDFRSLFFTNSFAVSQTYASGAENRIDISNPGFNSWDEFEKAAIEEWGDLPEWDKSKSVAENINAHVTYVGSNPDNSKNISFDEWLHRTRMRKSRMTGMDYVISALIPSESGSWHHVMASHYENLIGELNEAMGRSRGTQRGYYECYLNLENPMIIDGHGASWVAIPSNNTFIRPNHEIKASSQSSLTKDADWADRMYKIGQSWNNGDAIRDEANKTGEGIQLELKGKGKVYVPKDVDAIVGALAEYFNVDAKADDNTYNTLNRMASIILDHFIFHPSGKATYDYSDLINLDVNAETHDTREWAAIAESQGYDGVIFRNIVDVDQWTEIDEEDVLSDIYIAFSSNQVKDTRNENPTENPDIRYSMPSDNEVLGYIMRTTDNIDDIPLSDNLLEDNRVRYSIDNDNFIQSVIDKFDESSLTFGLYLDEKSVKKNLIGLMGKVMNESGINKKYRSETLQDTINSAKVMWYELKANQIDRAAETAWRAASRIVDDIDYNDDLYVQYKGMRDYLGRRKIQVPEGLEYDPDFIEFVKDNSGRMRFSDKGSSVNAVYKYLSKNYPQLLPAGIEDPIDMLLQIDYALEYTAPYREAYTSEEYTELVTDIAGRLMDIVAEGEAYQTVADKLTKEYENRIKAMKVRHEEAIRKVKETEKAKQDNTRKVWSDIARNWKQKYYDRIQQDKQERKEKKERGEHRKRFERVLDKYNTLCKWVLDPTKEKNVPEEFRKELAEFLQTLDLQTENSKALEAKTGHVAKNTLRMRELKDRLKDLSTSSTDADGNYTPGIFEVDAKIAFLLEKLADKLDQNGNTIDALDTEDIATIDEFMKLLIRNIVRYKQVKTETKMAELSDVGGRAVEDLKKKIDRDGQYTKYKGGRGALQTINATALTPAYLFDRLGAIKEMYDALRYNGFDTYIRNEKMIMDRLTEILEPYYNKKLFKKGKKMPGSIIEEWRDERSEKTLNLTYGSVTMSVAQMMSLYCLSKRGEQALGHMLVGGIKVTPIQTTSKIAADEKAKMGKVEAGAKRVKNAAGNWVKARIKGEEETTQKLVLTYEDVQTIISQLTPDQKDVADKLQDLMSVDMAKLGNEAHRELYGYEMFGEENYFPIRVDENQRDTDINTIGEVFEKIKSFGFTKPLTPNANKAIIVDDIFSIVADHCNGMNLYNAYLVPITDFMKVLNYTHTFEDGTTMSMKDAIEQAYGKDMLKYILNLMKDINGIKAENRGGLEGLMNKALGTAKKTAVFGNVRVALQQPTAIVRALAEIDLKYIKGALSVDSVKGFVPTVTTKTMEEMYKYCPIAQWKAWGYYDTYMGRDIEDVMMNNWSIADSALSGYYGQLDNATWSMIWQSVKAEQADKHPDMDHNSEEFLQLCGRRASEVFDKTQVVDSTFHRSDAMRNKQVAVKVFTAFMAEPTLTLNVFRAGLFNASEEKKAGNKAAATKIMLRTLAVIIAQAIVVSAAQAFADAWRGKDPGVPWGDDDDDDDKEAGYWTRWWHNLLYNVFDQAHLENNMYLVKDVTPYFNYMMSKWADYGDWNPMLRAIMGWDQDYLYSQNNLIFAAIENTANGVAQAFKKLEKGDDYDKSWYDINQKVASGIGSLIGFPAGTIMRDFHPVWDRLVPAVFAADTELMDAVANKMGYKPIEDKSESSKEKPKRKGLFSNIGKSEEEKEQERIEKARQEKIESIQSKTESLTGEAKDKKVWSYVTTYLKAENGDKPLNEFIQEGDYNTVKEYKEMYLAAGGDAEYFDDRIFATSKSAMKKTIVYDPTDAQMDAQNEIKNYLLTHGMTEAELSEMAYSSDTAKDMKIAFRINDKDAMLETLEPLVRAGLSYEDLERLWKNRNRVDVMKYKNSKGRYADRLKSTGIYNWPITGQITSYFGYRSAASTNGIGSTNHKGLDIGGNMGDPVAASDGGTVVYAGWDGGYGKVVRVQHDDGTITEYAHLSWWDAKVGDVVAQGQTIGNVGSTGNSTGPHLHFGVKMNGDYVDPLKYLASRS